MMDKYRIRHATTKELLDFIESYARYTKDHSTALEDVKAEILERVEGNG